MVAVRASQRTIWATFSAFSLRFGENGQSPRAHSGRRPIAGRCDRGIRLQ